MRRRVWLGISGGGLALLLCAIMLSGAVFAQEGEDGETSLGQAFIERLAGKLGITTDELQAAVQETQTDMVDEAVANGRLTEEQAENMREHIEAGEGSFGFAMGRAHGPRGGLFMLGPGPVNSDAIADELALTTAELRQQLADGATLAEVIEASGKTVDEIVTALVEQTATRLDEAVANGHITQAQADEMLASMAERLTEQIESGFFCPAPFERNLEPEAEETSSTV